MGYVSARIHGYRHGFGYGHGYDTGALAISEKYKIKLPYNTRTTRYGPLNEVVHAFYCFIFIHSISKNNFKQTHNAFCSPNQKI